MPNVGAGSQTGPGQTHHCSHRVLIPVEVHRCLDRSFSVVLSCWQWLHLSFSLPLEHRPQTTCSVLHCCLQLYLQLAAHIAEWYFCSHCRTVVLQVLWARHPVLALWPVLVQRWIGHAWYNSSWCCCCTPTSVSAVSRSSGRQKLHVSCHTARPWKMFLTIFHIARMESHVAVTDNYRDVSFLM